MVVKSNAVRGRVAYDEEAYRQDDEAEQDIAFLADLMNMPGDRDGTRLDDLADQLAAELDQEIAAMGPVGMVDNRLARSASAVRPATYDQWDDDALDEFLADQDFQAVDPMAYAPGAEPAIADEPGHAGPSFARRAGVLASIAGVLLIGAAVVVWALGGTSVGFGEAPLVKAPEGPIKVVPDKSEPEVATNEEGEAVFNSVSGVPPKSEERLVSPSEPVTDLPPITPQVSRVTLPDGRQVDADLPAGVDPLDTGARRVRTVLVRPDGTLIENPDAAAGASTAQAPAQAGPSVMDALTAADSALDKPADDGSSASGLPPLAAGDQTTPAEAPVPAPIQSITQPVPTVGAPVAEAAVPPAPIELPAAAAPAETAVQDTPAVPPPTPPSRPAIPRAAATPASAAQAAGNGPLDLAAAAQAVPAANTAAAPAPAAAAEAPAPAKVQAPAVSSGGAYVQVSSQKSETAALSAFESLKKKFPGVLGGLSAQVQVADLGAKGIYYRARIPQPSKEAAVALCEQLRAAGGDCLISR